MISRNAIVNALFNRLKDLEGVVTASRRLRDFSQVQPSEMPALYVVVNDQLANADKHRPTIWTVRCDVYLYVNDTGADGPQPALLDLIDAVEKALEVDKTLGGLASSCAISGAVTTDGGALGDLAVGIVPVEIRVPA